MTVKEALAGRSSTRGYTAEPLTEGELAALLNAGLQAPTATNRQEIHFTVLSGGDPRLSEIEEEKNRLYGISPEKNFYYDAPTVVLLSGEKEFRWSSVDAGIAVQSMALMAEALGLGSLIIGCIHDALRGAREKEFSRKLAFPENYKFQIAIAFGHKAVAKEPHTYDEGARVTKL